MRGLRFLVALITGLGLAAVTGGVAVAEERVALVIGNAVYEHAEPLARPTGDAEAVAAAFERLGFAVTLHLDLDQRGLQEALRAFGIRAAAAEVAVVYFAGHGMAVAGENFLLPVDSLLERERDLFYEAMPLGIVLSEVVQASRLGLVLLDAARANPLAERLRDAMGPDRGELVATGLAPVANPPPNTVIALAARPGTTAPPGTGEHSPFTAALLRHLEEPGLELDALFREVRSTVMALTGDAQEPETYRAANLQPFAFVESRPNHRPELAPLTALEVTSSDGPVPLEITPPTDPDGDLMIIQVTGVPWSGTLQLAGRPLLIGDALTVDELKQVTYAPEPTFEGSAGSFDFLVKDDGGGLALGSLPIEVERSNAPPVVTTRGIPLPVIPLDIERPVDPDGDPLTITVTAVPERGRVRNGDAVVGVGDELTPDEITGLVLEPGADGARGTFAFVVSDGRGASVTSGIDIDIPAMRLAPRPKLEVTVLEDDANEAGAAATRRPRTELPAVDGAAPGPEVEMAQLSAARSAEGGLVDCALCPELVPLPGGSFVMGADDGHQSEQPAHGVVLRPFALGRYEVTIGEYQACVDNGSCTPRPHLADLDPDRPIHDVSWTDAQRYVAWLRGVTGQPYRLPTEAEWEYAARAGTTTRFWWGDAVGSGHANCKDCEAEWNERLPARVGTHEANPFGLHAMNGGVMEWVADCWFPDHEDAPTDGSARLRDGCTERVLRGGSWRNASAYATSSSRLGYDAEARHPVNGFRVARDLH